MGVGGAATGMPNLRPVLSSLVSGPNLIPFENSVPSPQAFLRFCPVYL